MYLKFVQVDGRRAMEFHQVLGFTKTLDGEHYIKIEFQTLQARGNEEDELQFVVRGIHGDDPEAYDVLYALNDDGQTIETIRALPESIASMRVGAGLGSMAPSERGDTTIINNG